MHIGAKFHTRCIAGLLGLGLALLAPAAEAGEGQWLHLFHIGHDDSPNVVKYDLVVDSQCRPLGSSPVKAYWYYPHREEKTRGLSRLERRVYSVEGLVKQADGVRFHLSGRPEQSAVARTRRVDGQCVADLVTDVGGEQAILDKAWIRTDDRSLFRLPKVLFVDLFARSHSGRAITARIEP